MSQGKVLIVEDDRVTAEFLQYALQKNGLEVTTADDGLIASRLLARERPDLILLDLMLPNLDGWELCTLIRTLPDPELAVVPIVMLTARAASEDRLRGLRLGADDYLTKPFSIEEVLLKVRNLIARRRRYAAAAASGAAAGSLEEVQAAFCHELKNHLVAISGFGQRLENQAPTLSPEKIRTYASIIRKSSDHLSGLVDELVVFQQVEANQFDATCRPTNVGRVVEGLAGVFAPRAEEKGLRLRVELGTAPEVLFNEPAAKICVSSLLENAIKYSGSEGEVAVALTAADGRVTLAVSDEGPGIPEDERESIFERFYRGRAARATTHGTGLGLYVVKTLAEALGARVSVDGRSVGARFRMEFCTVEAGRAPARS